ncbi:restriction endonuclease subunit S [Pseudomonas fluorescens]|uniref:restriction endonuclease subunit S n=1 Tax=Pseudomonas fluorescens TaxID=294 RepID=UPI001BE77CB3|nr:restriction endonuclease subunit S [Pseudomonas fluorescens]MBT2374913.1 restriction endonuclease subunit S [Pseudomonas fluorescens]
MTALLTDNLQLLAGAPNGIKKLRELILELAVRGKLVPQDPSDEPASELLKRIAEEKVRLVDEGKIRKQKPLAKIGEEEKPFELPANWRWGRLGSQVIESSAGWSPSCDPRPRESNEWGVLKVSAVSWGVYQPEENKALPASLEARPEHEVTEGDFLVSRANTAELVARSVVVETTPAHLMLSDKIVRLKLTSLCERRYVNLANSAPLARDYYSRVAGGTSSSMKNVSREQILNLPLALPPLAEQHRIVAKVDELMALCDRLEAQQTGSEIAHTQLVHALLGSLTKISDATEFATNWDCLTEHFHTLFTTEPSIDALKQALLQLAVMGKLVPQDPNDEPASDLLTRIAAKKQRLMAEGKLKKQKPPTAIAAGEKLFELPTGWQWARLLDCALLITDGEHLTPQRTSDSTQIPLVTAKNVRDGFMDYGNTDYVERSIAEKCWGRCKPEVGDIMMVSVGATLGRLTVIKENMDMVIVRSVTLIRPLFVDADFLALMIRSPQLQSAIWAGVKQSAQPGLYLAQSSSLLMAVPPLAEQHRIVAKIDQLMALCNQLKTRLIQARQLNEQLTETLIERALFKDGQSPLITTDQKATRTLLAAEVAHRLHAQRTFGQRKLQKVVYLAEHAARLKAIQGSYLRNVAGPHDRQLMNQVESGLQNNQWYERIARETKGHAYRPLSKAGQHRQAYSTAWSATERATIEQVIELMRDWDTDRCEMTVTLYAVWNDFILEGHPVSDEAIVDEVIHSWNDTKLRFGKTEWLAVLAEMKKHKILVPTGFGKRTTGGMLSLPGFE